MAVSGVFGKLQLKDQPEILVLDPPASFEPEVKALKGVTVRRSARRSPVAFSLAFMTIRAQLEQYAALLAKGVDGDAVVWVAYPKGSSKCYTSELGRDAGWQAPSSKAT